MPPGSGKSYISLKIIEYFKIPTLILCDNAEEYWENFIELKLLLRHSIYGMPVII
jgi:superfamily II DNA or RNA helicase